MNANQTPAGDDLEEIPKNTGIFDDPKTVEEHEDAEIEEDNDEVLDDEPEREPDPGDDEGDPRIREPD